MHDTLEIVQMNSRKIIDGNLKVYFSLLSLIIIQFGAASQILALAVFAALSIYADWKSYIKILRIPLLFLMAGLLVILFTVEGKPIFRIGFLVISNRSAQIAMQTFLRSLASFTIMSFLVITTSIPEFVSSLSKLRIPSFITEILFLAYRAIQILMEEIYRLDTAASVRMGYRSASCMVRTTSLLAFSSFIRAMNRSEIMDEAMKTRCYDGKYPLLGGENRGVWLSVLIITGLMAAGWLF
ncbi:cobalt ECF transporter T component CbiQ [Archaeoglobus neptunius]|uniref:cobalt ECF transporter T component CbiQ n=1 Tax=Archaeoglobus neptunius TaxID=2798580 RepID=UPI001925FF9D|nr:cobalt ECF transporter T component CbiQ [Archaeoglobus neptunius]